MLKIRLKRVGRKHDPSFRIVITEHTAPAQGGYLESVGFYNAAQKQLQLDKERVQHWLSNGAQPSPVVHNILVKEGVLKAEKIQVHARPKKGAVAEEEAPKEEAPAEGAEAPAEEAEAPVEEKTEEAPAEEEKKEEEVPAEEEKAEEAPAESEEK